MTLRVKASMNRVKGVNSRMNRIVSLMAAGAKKRFSREEYRRIREEANALFQKLTEENKDLPKAMKKHTGTNIFPAIAVYKTLLAHGLTTDEATDVIRSFFYKICEIMFRPAAWYQHIAGNYHRYPAGMVKHSLRDFSPCPRRSTRPWPGLISSPARITPCAKSMTAWN